MRLVHHAGGRALERDDEVAVESPLEIRLHGESFAVVMRTPGDDLPLAAGFLLAEGLIATADDLRLMQPLRTALGDVIEIRLSGEAAAALPSRFDAKRKVVANAACGTCGRTDLAALQVDRAPLPLAWTVTAAVVASLPETLRNHQAAFARSGGLHAAGLFTRDADLVTLAEDVGRHNAVDKVVGRMLLARRLPLDDHVLVVSGRTAFEIVQKAAVAGVPVVAAVSAPTTQAVDLAEASGITLIGFVRDGAFNVYTHGGRIAPG